MTSITISIPLLVRMRGWLARQHSYLLRSPREIELQGQARLPPVKRETEHQSSHLSRSCIRRRTTETAPLRPADWIRQPDRVRAEQLQKNRQR